MVNKAVAALVWSMFIIPLALVGAGLFYLNHMRFCY